MLSSLTNLSPPVKTSAMNSTHGEESGGAEDISRYVKLLQTLKQNGVSSSDPHYQGLLHLLKRLLCSHTASEAACHMPKWQLEQIRAQVLAQRLLTRNAHVSSGLLLASRGVSSGSPVPSSKLSSTVDTTTVLKAGIPAKAEPNFVQREREKRIFRRVSRRQEELNSIPVSSLSADTKMKLMIERKKFAMLEKQRSFRSEVALYLKRTIALQASMEPENFVKFKPHTTVQPSEQVDNMKELQKRQRAKLRLHSQFVNAVLEHAKAFKEYHASKLNKQKKLARAVAQHRSTIERKRQQKKERLERDRLKALKENDEDKYIQLLEQTKNDRLSQLLKQTDDFLGQLGVAVQSYQVEREEETLLEQAGQEGKGKQKLSPKSKRKPLPKGKSKDQAEQASIRAGEPAQGKSYYTIAHSIQETIHKQPDILVGGTLKQYQLYGLQWLVSLYNNNLNGVLADEMGLGKTIQTIALIAYLMEMKNVNGPYLIIVPLSTLSNWQYEFTTWTPSVSVVPYKGNPQARKLLFQKKILPQKFNVVLTTYEFVMKDKDKLSKVNWKYVIIDEGHRMKNRHCKLAQTLGKHYKARNRLILTGTPLQNSLQELWSILNFLLPSIFNSCSNFESWFNAPFQQASLGVDQPELSEEENLLIIQRLHKVLRPFLLRRLKKEVEDQLPDKVEKVIRCDLSATQKKMQKDLRETGSMFVNDGAARATPRASGLSNAIMHLRKIANHPYLFDKTESWTVDELMIRQSGKFVVLDRIMQKLQKFNHRMLIFSQMTQLMSILEDLLRFRGIEYLRLDGSTKTEDREEMLRLFNAPRSPYDVFLLSTRAGGLGLNLQTADTVILFDSDWNPHMDMQAQDRAHRIGQKREVLVLRLISAGTVEEHILTRANYKKDIDAKIIQAGMFNQRSSARERQQFLQELLSKDDIEDDTKDIPNNKQINKMIARSEKEFEAFQVIDKERDEEFQKQWTESGESGRFERLSTVNEIPYWMAADVRERPGDGIEYGRGHRERTVTVYQDSDNIEELLETSPSEAEQGRPRKKRRKTNDKKRQREKRVPDKGRRPSKKRRRKEKVKDGGKSSKRKLLSIWNQLRNLKDKTGERIVSDMFYKTPSKKEYPDYYEVIKRPISLKRIYSKITNGKYSNDQECVNDFKLLFQNAYSYNREDSQIYRDAKTLEALLQELLRD